MNIPDIFMIKKNKGHLKQHQYRITGTVLMIHFSDNRARNKT